MVNLSNVCRYCLKAAATSISNKKRIHEIKQLTSNLRGTFAAYKDKNVSCQDMIRSIRLTLDDELGGNFEKYCKRKLSFITPINPIGCGVTVFNIGSTTGSYDLKYAEMHSRIIVKLGTATETACSVGKIVDRKPYDHVTLDLVNRTLPKFLGRSSQVGTPFYVQPEWTLFKEMNREEAKLGHRNAALDVELNSAVCKGFDPPYLQIDLRCNGRYYVERFVSDLGIELGTCAHLTDMERTKHFIFDQTNALPSYKWYFKHIEECITQHRDEARAALSEIRATYADEIRLENEKRNQYRNIHG